MVIFIISAEETIRIANPRSGNRVGDAVLHYKPVGGTIPLPINFSAIQPHQARPSTAFACPRQ